MSDEERSRAPPMQRRGGNRQPEQRMIRPPRRQDERTAYMHDRLLPPAPATGMNVVPPPPAPRAPLVRPRQPTFPIRTTGKTGPDEPRGTIPMLPRPVLETNVYEPPAIAYTQGELTDFVTRMYGTTPRRDDDATAT